MVLIIDVNLCFLNIFSVSTQPAEGEDPSADEPRGPMLPAEILTVPKIYSLSRDESITLQCDVKNAGKCYFFFYSRRLHAWLFHQKMSADQIAKSYIADLFSVVEK